MSGIVENDVVCTDKQTHKRECEARWIQLTGNGVFIHAEKHI